MRAEGRAICKDEYIREKKECDEIYGFRAFEEEEDVCRSEGWDLSLPSETAPSQIAAGRAGVPEGLTLSGDDFMVDR